jgi:hypothetical protein
MSEAMHQKGKYDSIKAIFDQGCLMGYILLKVNANKRCYFDSYYILHQLILGNYDAYKYKYPFSTFFLACAKYAKMHSEIIGNSMIPLFDQNTGKVTFSFTFSYFQPSFGT